MKAPDFELLDQDKSSHKLSDYAGKWVVLYFYPKDDTPGCTKEACSFRDQREYLQQKGLTVIGVSKDSPASHKKFAEKYKLNFTLLSDPDKVAAIAYGAFGMKKFMGREFEGVLRNTYLIDPAGNIAKKYEGVTPADHALEILRDFETLAK